MPAPGATNPLRGPLGPGNPLRGPLGPGNPLRGPLWPGNPLRGPLGPGNPLEPGIHLYAPVSTPLGPALVAWSEAGVTAVEVGEGDVVDIDAFVTHYTVRTGRKPQQVSEPPAAVIAALGTGDNAGVAIDLRGLTPFATAVLSEVAAIPRGDVRSYGAIARAVGRPGAVRAVGTAVGRNPIPLLVPCHRVVRSDGGIGGFGFGIDAKRKLLAGEGLPDLP